MAAPLWVDDGVALVAELLRTLVLEETVEGAEREGEVEVVTVRDVALIDVKLLEMTVDVGTDPALEPPREVALVTVVEALNVVESPAELPPIVEDPDVTVLAEVEILEPELPVMPSRL
jgi:hypothetical protein